MNSAPAPSAAKQTHSSTVSSLPATRRDALLWYADRLEAAGRKSNNLYLETQRRLCQRDLFYLLVHGCRRLDVNRDWLFNRCREVQAEPDGCLDLWARFHYKSTLITFGLTLQEVLNDPETTIGIFSYSRALGKKFLVQIKRELETNDRLKRLFPDILYADPAKQSPKWSEDDGLIVKRRGNPKESTVEAWGLVEGQPTGRHFKLRVYDDVVTRESVTTAEMIAKTTEALDLSQNLGTEGGRARYLGTRYNLGDTYQTMIDRGMVRVRMYPATDDGTETGQPVLLSPAEWAKVRQSQPTTIAAQMLQNPAGGLDRMFKAEWLRAYTIRPATLHVYILCDPSKGRSADSDRTGIAVIGVDALENKYLLGGCRHRMDLDQRWNAIKALHRKWSAEPGVLMVKIGYEQYGMLTDLEHFKFRMRQENYPLAIEELNWPRDGTKSKEDRVGRLVPDIKGGKFAVPLVVKATHLRPDGEAWSWTGDAPDEWYVESGEIRTRPMPESRVDKIAREFAERQAGKIMLMPLAQLDETKRPYDLTRAFIEEMIYFPHGAKKDLIDAVSRIYDMNPTPPKVFDKRELEPRVYVDT